MCSTPFGITDYIGGAEDLPQRDRASRFVLNAFRHHGLYRAVSPWTSPSAPWICAQRLSASRIISGSQPLDESQRALDMCSTPFGITDYIGSPGLRSRHAGTGCSTPFGITDYIGLTFVTRGELHGIVLNAFRHHGLYRTLTLPARALRPPLCAQRLSASRIISAGQVSTLLVVRDQCSTPFGITDYIGGPVSTICLTSVLNAFRHHGLYRPLPGAVTFSDCTRRAQRLSASRIISGARAGARRGAMRSVLNAFRHHGLYRASVAKMMVLTSQMCSTPFGITDYIGSRYSACRRARRLSAQRLSASRIYRSRTRALLGRTLQCCAQRLSASRIISADRGPGGGRRDVLNAFRHHGLYRLPSEASSVSSTARCSTPFGITDYIGLTL